MIAAVQDSELVEIVDHMLAAARESVLARPFRARTVPDMWRAAESAAESGKSNAGAVSAMLHMRDLRLKHPIRPRGRIFLWGSVLIILGAVRRAIACFR